MFHVKHTDHLFSALCLLFRRLLEEGQCRSIIRIYPISIREVFTGSPWAGHTQLNFKLFMAWAESINCRISQAKRLYDLCSTPSLEISKSPTNNTSSNIKQLCPRVCPGEGIIWRLSISFCGKVCKCYGGETVSVIHILNIIYFLCFSA